MKKRIAFLALAACGIVAAQSSHDVVKFHLTHPAMVGDIELPAGTCTAGILNSANGNTALVIRCESGVQAIALVNPVKGEFSEVGRAGVVLTRRGDTYQIDEVWLSGTGNGYHIVSSYRE